MNPSGMLNLRDIHLPDSVSWWPPAPGWWILILLVLLSVAGFIWLLRYWKRPRLDKRARAEINRIYQDYLSHGDQQLYLQQMSILMRRIGISYLARNDVAGKSGVAWYQQLNQLVKDKKLDDESIRILSQLPYQKELAIDDAGVNHLHHQVSSWASGLAER